jgi:hypothetical protein
MGMHITIQPAEHVDHITADGEELTKLPYPFHTDETGNIGRQDFWKGDPLRVIGFAKDSAVQELTLRWTQALADLQQAVGMYLVTEDSNGAWSTHDSAVGSITVDLSPMDGQTQINADRPQES